MIWLFALGVLVLAIYHIGFRHLVLVVIAAITALFLIWFIPLTSGQRHNTYALTCDEWNTAGMPDEADSPCRNAPK